MPNFRSGFTLCRMVEAAKELTDDAGVLGRIDAVLRIMGTDRTYGKGRPLVDALERVVPWRAPTPGCWPSSSNSRPGGPPWRR
ncbi:hypothetical protein [Kitasatospora sp. NPDC093806]|uniref:hypothetical protein n=1 Tax=Kitasatospora sp. NPDC093806 TaxID=3155075 RepID=UPI003442FFC0